jgi:hypothetical protein
MGADTPKVPAITAKIVDEALMGPKPLTNTSGVSETAANENRIMLEVVGFRSRTTILIRAWPNAQKNAVARASVTAKTFNASPNDSFKPAGSITNYKYA